MDNESVKWKHTSDDKFSTKSAHAQLCVDEDNLEKDAWMAIWRMSGP